MKNLIITAILTSVSGLSAFAQTQQAPSFILNQHLSGNQHYKASQFIEMGLAPGSTTGFEYNAQTSGGEFIAEIDPFMVFPPEEGEFGGVNADDTGVVGTIGGAFSISQSGAANYTLPVKLPEGINGLRPALSIDYNSQAGNGFLGNGWNLSGLSSISRTGSNLFNDGVVRNIKYDYLDNYELDGSRLIMVAQLSNDRTEYRTELETYSKIISYNDRLNFPVTFEVYTKSGYIIQYGFTNDSKIELSNSSSITRTWLINKISDRFGNTIDFEYFEDNENGEFGISRILYGGNSTQGISHPVEVSFTYENTRKDKIISFIAPEKISTLSRNISSVIIKVNNEVQYSYILDYIKNSIPLRLNSIFLQYGDDPLYHTNPINFSYGSSPPLSIEDSVKGVVFRYYYDGQYFIYDAAKTIMTDLTGDGLADLLIVYRWESNNAKVANYRLYKQTSNNNFVCIEDSILPNEEFVGFYPCDINGDMITDVLMVKTALSNGRRTDINPWVSNGNGFTKYPNFFVDQKISKIVILTSDFNGDGKSEVAVVDKDYSSAHSLLSTFLFDFENGCQVSKKDCTPFGNLTDRTYYFETRDMTADGIPEIIIMDDGGINIFQYIFVNNQVNVEFIKHIDTPNSNDNNIYWGDFNADGYCDLLWKKKSDNSWKAALYNGENLVEIYCPVKPISSDTVNISTLKYSIKDYNGDGFADISERYKKDTTFVNRFYFCRGSYFEDIAMKMFVIGDVDFDICDMVTDINGDGINDLLFQKNSNNNTSVRLTTYIVHRNNFSSKLKTVTDEYKNKNVVTYQFLNGLSSNYIKYNDAVYPFADINIPIPIVTIHEAFEKKNENIPEYYRTKKYYYEGAKLHKQGRGFLGFLKFTETDVDTKIIKESYNDIAFSSNYITLLPLKTITSLGGSGKVLSETEFKWTIFNGFEASRFRYVPYLNEVHTREWDLNGDFVKTQRSVSSYDENGYIYGNPNIEKAYSDEENLGPDTPESTFKYGKIVTNHYRYDLLSDWLLGIVDSTIIKHEQKNEPARYERIYNTIYPKGHANFPLLKSTVSNPSDTLAVKTEFDYNSVGLITLKKVSAPNYARPLEARTETYHYKPEYGYRFLSGVTNTAGHYTENVFNTTKGTLEKKIDVNGLETRYYYNDMGNLKETRYYDSTRSVSVNRWASGHEDAPNNPGGPKALWYNWQCVSGKLPIITFFDHLGREIRVVSYNQEGIKIYTDKYYDRFGRLWTVSDPYFPGSDPLTLTTLFDDLSRPIKITAPGDLVTNIIYSGRTISTSGPGPVKSIVIKDAAGRTVKSADAEGNYVEYLYYSNGLLKSTTINSMQNTTITFNYDKNGNKIAVTDPTRGTNQWRYDPYNQLIFSEDGEGHKIEYYYDMLGRLTSWQNPDKIDEYLTNVYHTTPGMIGLIDYIEQSGHKRQYFYNSANFYRVSKTGETFDGQTSFTIFGYDELGRQNKLVYPTGIELVYRYNNAGYITKVTNEQQGLVIWDKPKYNQRGQLTNSRKANIYETIKEYYPTSGLLQSTLCSNIQWFEYKYDSAANMTDRFNHHYTSGNTSLNEHFSYDNRGQLTAVYRDGTFPRHFQYDAISNMRSKNDAGTFIYYEPSPYQPSEMSLLSLAPTALTQTHRASYNSYNKIDTLTSDEYRLEITYGLGSQRIKQKLYSIENNSTHLVKEKQFISGNTEIVIFEQKTDTITYITSPEGLTAIVVASSNTAGREWYWVFTDHLGSITTLVRNSDGQKVEMSYDAWGNRRDPATWENYNGTLPSFITDRGYTGHEHLDEFTLINMNGRMYDPQTARFLSPDAVVADPGNPAGYNPYAYVLNNPLKYTDPSGYEPFTIAAYVIAAIIIYSNSARANGNPATVSYEWDFTKWFSKDKPGFGGIGFTTNSSFTNSTYFVSINPTNGGGGTVGYNTQYGWGSGSSPQNMYFPNHNAGASEAAAVNSIARMDRSISDIGPTNYMDILLTRIKGISQFIDLPSLHIVWTGEYGSGRIIGGVPEWWGNYFDGGSNSFELGPIGLGVSFEIGFPEWLASRRVAYGLDFGIVADNTALGIGFYYTTKKPIGNPLCFSLAPEVIYANSAKNSQIKIGDLSGSGYEIMGSVGSVGATYGWDTRSTYSIYSISGFGKGIDIGYGTWETNTKVFQLEDLFGK